MIWLVALGGALGSVCRFLVGPAIQRAFGFTFPFGTLFINIAGSFILGVVAEIAIEGGPLSPNGRAFSGSASRRLPPSRVQLETLALGGQVMRQRIRNGDAMLPWPRLGPIAARQVPVRRPPQVHHGAIR
jgi:hypothetical protein